MKTKRKRKMVRDEERQLIHQRRGEGHTLAAIAAELKRAESTVSKVLKKKGVALTIAVANKALAQSNSSILTVSLGNLCDILAAKAPEVEEVRLFPKTRQGSARINLEFTV